MAAKWLLKAPRELLTTSAVSAMKKIISPTSPFKGCVIASKASDVPRNFAIGPLKPSSVILVQAKPLAPKGLTTEYNSSAVLRVYSSAIPLRLIALTLPPLSTAPLKTPKSVVAAKSDRSVKVIPKRISGLSEPYLFIASS